MSRLAQPVTGVPCRWVQVGDGPLAVLEAGPAGGEPVVCIPGYTGSKEDFGPLLAPLAAAGLRVLAVDLRGQYQSPGPDDPAAYRTGQLAADLLGLLDALGCAPAHLLGHSFGGLVARAAVLARPAAARTLTLLGSGPAALDGVRGQVIAALGPLLRSQGQEALWEALSRAGGATPFGRERFLSSSAAGLLGMGEALLSEPDRTAELAAAGVATLVCHGADDDAWAPAVQAGMAARLGARYEVIPGAAHSPAVENPTSTAAVLLDFWRRQAGPAATVTP